MASKTIGAAQFKAECLKIIDQINRDHQPVTITRRGQPVAVLSPAQAAPASPIVGALRGTVLRYDEPFAPAADAEDWDAAK
jgi:prevent-host-death family protein